MADLSFIFLIYIIDFSDDLTTNVKLFADDTFPAGIYLLKVNNRNTRTRCEI